MTTFKLSHLDLVCFWQMPIVQNVNAQVRTSMFRLITNSYLAAHIVLVPGIYNTGQLSDFRWRSVEAQRVCIHICQHYCQDDLQIHLPIRLFRYRCFPLRLNSCVEPCALALTFQHPLLYQGLSRNHLNDLFEHGLKDPVLRLSLCPTCTPPTVAAHVMMQPSFPAGNITVTVAALSTIALYCRLH